MDIIHPQDPSLKFPFVKDVIDPPRKMMMNLFLEYFNGKQDFDEKNDILYRPYETSWEIDSISCHFTESIRVKCPTNNKPTLVQVWKSMEPSLLRSFKTVDEARSHMLYTLKAQECNIFSPALCMRLYLGYNDSREPVKIIDPSAGWTDRMITAIAAGDFVSQYDGYDPNKDLVIPFKRVMDTLDTDNKCRFFCEPFQKAEVPKEYYDLGVTSPPYFDLEIYSKDSTQSVSEDTSTYPKWLDNFYRPYLRNLHYAIRPGGKIIIYVSDYSDKNIGFVDLAKKTVSILEKEIGKCKCVKTGYLKAKRGDKKPPRPFFIFERH